MYAATGLTSNMDRTEQLSGAARSNNAQHDTTVDLGADIKRTTSQSVDYESHREEITSLARQLTRHSTRPDTNSSDTIAGSVNLFSKGGEKVDSRLDPHSPDFSPRDFIKASLNLQRENGQEHLRRTSGIAFRDLNVHGFGSAADFQRTYASAAFEGVSMVRKLLGLEKPRKIDILQHFDGLVREGEMLVVLGPPGSGCSTFLKTLTGETHGIFVDKKSYINYQGISAKQMHSNFRGEAIYTAEVDVHFPALTVGDTLAFAAEARAPREIPGGVSRAEYASLLKDMIMAVFGILHTNNTKVGNDFVRGVSGGERKRVTIAEAALSGAPISAWDNSTRGLDSANAIEFVKTLRMNTELTGSAALVSIYQAPAACYDMFDKVVVLYEGRQIYFGKTTDARKFFFDMGFDSPARQTDADFLTSLTSPVERIVRAGFEKTVPRTPDQFAQVWKASAEHKALMEEIAQYEKDYPIGGEHLQKFKESRRAQQAKGMSHKSPYTLSYPQQVKLCLKRGFMRLKADPSIPLSALIANAIMALVISSVFYNLPSDTNSFFQRGSLLFFAILMNAFGSALEILTLYAQRGIVEKHQRYALYHPSAEAFASMLTDMPYKICNTILFNLVLYFMTNLRREPGAFFFFLLTSFLLTMAMSGLFRTIASTSRSLAQALAPAAILILAIVIYTGFVIPTRYMLGWARWINYLDVVGYGFEALMVNEFHNRDFPCSAFVPSGAGYESAAGTVNQICTTVGSVAGSAFVNGDDYINSQFAYYVSHKWRNVGIIIVFAVGLTCTYLAATEFITAQKSRGEVLVFRRGHVPKDLLTKHDEDDLELGEKTTRQRSLAKRVVSQAEATAPTTLIQRQTAVFSWQDVVYDIKIKKEDRRILDHVDGWVKPGTLTALMGVSGAGKTTLLDVLATRVTMGVVTGDMLVDGRQRDESFQRKTGYVQQQDLHLSTSTVREALEFSAILRQPANVSREEKVAYVDSVIDMLEMSEYADAVVGVPGEGLNVEQRKRLTIGVELAAKPQLLLFLDEPTSGLDSQTAWSICNLMEKLTKSGQAILCTIHQPSAMLFQRFDRLLFLARGGRTVYFGEIGENSKTVIEYFEGKGGFKCPGHQNPAEWMLEVIGAAPGSHTDIDWPAAWNESPEKVEVRKELARLKQEGPSSPDLAKDQPLAVNKADYREFAAPFLVQFVEVQKRVFQQIWRSPAYLWSKTAICVGTGLFVGFSFFKVNNTSQGLQNQMFSIFMIFTIFGQLVQQIMPQFVQQRDLYEVRERPSKSFSWKAFMLSNILVEIPWNTLMAILLFVTFYYPVGLYRNAEPTDTVHERGALFFLFIWIFLMFTSTFAHMVIAGMETAENGGNIANLLFSLTLIFCGILVGPNNMPRFWIFMYWLSPFHWLAEGILGTAVANTVVTCADNEFLNFQPSLGQTCAQYMEPFIASMGGEGYLQDPNALADCSFCQISSTNTFLSAVSVSYDNRWRNFGVLFAYVIFNVVGALVIYWLARVPKKKANKKDKKE